MQKTLCINIIPCYTVIQLSIKMFTFLLNVTLQNAASV
jgi:hypothetical protein